MTFAELVTVPMTEAERDAETLEWQRIRNSWIPARHGMAKPFKDGDRNYLEVWNPILRSHGVYCFEEDVFYNSHLTEVIAW